MRWQRHNNLLIYSLYFIASRMLSGGIFQHFKNLLLKDAMSLHGDAFMQHETHLTHPTSSANIKANLFLCSATCIVGKLRNCFYSFPASGEKFFHCREIKLIFFFQFQIIPQFIPPNYHILTPQMTKYLDRCKMKTIHYYAVLFTLTTAATLALCDSSSPSEGEKSSPGILPFENTQRVERSPKYDFGLGKRRFILTNGGPGKKRLPH